jgi:hypothetical protein
MTAIPSSSLRRAPRAAQTHRVWNVVRLHLTNTWVLIQTPAIILALIFGVNYALWSILEVSITVDAGEAVDGTQWSGAATFIFVYMTVVAAQAITVTFPFALGYSVTRREYYLGTSLLFLLVSAGYAAVMAILAAIEDATGGWGLGGHMFTAIYFGDEGGLVRLFVFFSLFLFFFFAGAAIATIYMRWRMYGMIAFWAALAVVLIALVALATYTDGWPAVGSWFAANGATGVAAWLLLPTAVAAITGYLVLRRATPKN